MCDKVKVQELDSATQELINCMYGGQMYARFGDSGYLLPASYNDDADDTRNMTVRPDDVWLTSYPRSGTNWTLELMWLLMNDIDFDASKKTPIHIKRILLESKHLPNREYLERVAVFYEETINGSSPRFIQTHIAFSLLPPHLLDTAKVVYIARDPRDVAVSYYHLHRLLYTYSGDFKTFWNNFLNNLVRFTPYFPHVKEAWALRHHPNMLFIFYEDMKKDLPSCIRRLADFLSKEVTDEQTVKLCEYLDIENFKRNESVNPPWLNQVNPAAESFVRKGIPGGWREYFDEEMAAQAQAWVEDSLAGSHLRFPTHTV
ncbi:luciferin sulfotransferase-like [Cydia splendana]|uniref:luciferin sulfotransferase-like n=1 Tax=Cydia splendana TaxID=1100963 RepID=UPI0028F49F00